MFRDCHKKIEDLEKKNMSCFETKCRQRKSVCAWIEINSLLAPGICLFGSVANQNRFQFLNLMESSSRFIHVVGSTHPRWCFDYKCKITISDMKFSFISTHALPLQ